MSQIYIAAKFEHSNFARSVMDEVAALGHTITHDWTKENADGLEGAVRRAYLQKCGEADVEGVRSCDVFLMINHPEGYGLMCELGMALALGKRVIIVFAELRDTVFFHLPGIELATDVPHALQLLGNS